MARTTTQLRHVWAPHCPDGDLVRVATSYGVGLLVRRAGAEAFRALLQITEAHGYRLAQHHTGAFNCRRINHDPNRGWSLHAFGIAGDLNWQDNPAGSRFITDMPPGMVRDILALRTGPTGTDRVFRWGGDWDYLPATGHSFYDAMHYELVASPAELAHGTTRRPNDPEGDTMQQGEQGDHVADWQETINIFLVATGSPADDPILLGCDGTWGPRTTEAMRHVIGRLRAEPFHKLGDYPIALAKATPDRAGIGLAALVGATIAEREATVR